MSVIVEFTLDGEEFTLGRVLAGPPRMHVELERIVPTGPSVVPFLWARGENHEAFERRVLESEPVSDLVVLDRLDDEVLYRIEWTDEPHSLLEGIDRTEGVILEASADDGWTFRLRFSDHDYLSRFYNYCTDNDIAIHIERSYTLTERSDVKHDFGLSREQREALVLGLRRGYFATPSRVSLDDLSDELGISQQAMSDRIRRGTERVLTEVLLTTTSGTD